MTRFKPWLLITVVMVMTLTMPSYEEKKREDWSDTNDMSNFDPSTNTVRKNKDIKRQTPPSSPSGTSDTVEEETDIPADSSKDLGSRPTGKPRDNQVDFNHSPLTQVDMDCPPCPRVEEPVRSCHEACTCPECEPLKECVWEQPALTILRKYVRNVLIHIGDQKPVGDKEDLTFHMSLSADDMVVLEKFVDKGNVKHVHVIVRVAASQDTKMEKFALWLEHEIGLKLDRLIQFMILALASVALLRFIGLIISSLRTWYDLYKQAEILQQLKVMIWFLTSLASMMSLGGKVQLTSWVFWTMKVPIKVIVEIFLYIYRILFPIKPVPRPNSDTQKQQAIPDNKLTTKDQPEEIQSLMAKTKNPPDESVPHQSDAGAPTQIQQDEPKNTLPTNDQVEEIHFSMEETKNPPDEKDPRFPLPNLLVKGTSCPVSAENHGGAKVQLDRDHIPSTSCQNTSVNVETEMVSLHAEEDCVQHISGHYIDLCDASCDCTENCMQKTQMTNDGISGGTRKCVDGNRAELEKELLQQRINHERELHQLNVANMKEKKDRESERHQLTVANMQQRNDHERELHQLTVANMK